MRSICRPMPIKRLRCALRPTGFPLNPCGNDGKTQVIPSPSRGGLGWGWVKTPAVKTRTQTPRSVGSRPRPTTKPPQTPWQSPRYANPNQRRLVVSKANPNTAAIKNRPMNGRCWNAKLCCWGSRQPFTPTYLLLALCVKYSLID